MVIKPVSPFAADVSGLIAELDRYQQSLYPPESNHLDSPQALSGANCRLVGAYRDERLVGVGAAKILDGYAELKRFYITEGERGRGVGECLIATLERWVYQQGIMSVRLETGIRQAAALRFYEKLGYAEREPFGDYQPDPLSRFMEKQLPSCEVIMHAYRGPHYLVAFTSLLVDRSESYARMAETMVSRAQGQPGFLGMISTRNDRGEGFTASFWRNQSDVQSWKNDRGHQEAQRLGREKFYGKYRITTVLVEE